MSNSFSFAVYNLKIAAKYERGFDVTYVYMPKTLFLFHFLANWQTQIQSCKKSYCSHYWGLC